MFRLYDLADVATAPGLRAAVQKRLFADLLGHGPLSLVDIFTLEIIRVVVMLVAGSLLLACGHRSTRCCCWPSG